MFDLENWIIDVLNFIHDEVPEGWEANIHLDPAMVQMVKEAYEKTKWIEIY